MTPIIRINRSTMNTWKSFNQDLSFPSLMSWSKKIKALILKSKKATKKVTPPKIKIPEFI